MPARRRGPTNAATSEGSALVGDDLHTARALAVSAADGLVDVVSELRKIDRLDALVEVLDDAASVRLAARDYEGARQLIESAFEFDVEQEGPARAERWYRLADALDGCGDVEAARQALIHAVGLAEIIGDSRLATAAILRYILPGHWHPGMSRVHELLGAVRELDPSPRDRAVLDAVQAIVDVRSAITESERGQQFAGVSRPAAPQALAERVLASSDGFDAHARCVAHLAWRATHNGAETLAQRRVVSRAASVLAESVGQPSLRVEAGIWRAVDSLEAGDRAGFEAGVAAADRAASRDRNPRLRWRALTTAAGAAHLAGHLDDAVRLRREAWVAGERARVPSMTGVDVLLGAQEALLSDEGPMLADHLADDSAPELASPSARAVMAALVARRGDTARATAFAHDALRRVDSESGYLFVGTRVAHAATLLDDDDLARTAIALLAPWASHVSVASNGWWIDGPVSLWLAELHRQLDDVTSAWRHLALAELVAAEIGDARSIVRAARLRTELPPSDVAAPEMMSTPSMFTALEHRTLELLGSGATNQEIAVRFHYSVATIRRTTSSIYRKLGVRSRSQAVAQALRLGIIAPP